MKSFKEDFSKFFEKKAEPHTYFLEPKYDTRKSFYRKAKVIIENDGTKKLQSYDTIVAEVKGITAIVYDTYSATTLRHIKEFLLQEGIQVVNKAQIIKDYCSNK